jgi:putative membrane protein
MNAGHPITSNDLAAIRTLMAADRTLMAWIRTSLSLLSFGFTIYKVMQGLLSAEKISDPDMPRNVGLFLAVMGTLAIVMGTIEFWQTLRELRQLSQFSASRPTLVMAFLMSATGIALCAGIIAHAI